MKKKLLVLAVLATAAFSSFAQTKQGAKLSIGADFGLPTGQADQIYSAVIGASIKLELPVNNNGFNFIVNTGFSNFIVKSAYSGYVLSANYVPVEIGGKYYVDPRFYFEGDLGVSFNVNSNYSASRAAFVYAPGIGLSFPNASGSGLDASLRYEGRAEPGGTISQVALRLAYKFGL
jgi:hypothetical protein